MVSLGKTQGTETGAYNGEKYSGRKGFYAMCGGGQMEPGGAIHIPLTIKRPTIIIFRTVHTHVDVAWYEPL